MDPTTCDEVYSALLPDPKAFPVSREPSVEQYIETPALDPPSNQMSKRDFRELRRRANGQSPFVVRRRRLFMDSLQVPVTLPIPAFPVVVGVEKLNYVKPTTDFSDHVDLFDAFY